MNPALKEALKELARTAILAAIAVVLANLSAGVAIDVKAVGIAALIALLRAVDKLLHESGVKTPLDFG